MDRQPIKPDPDECIPDQHLHLQLQFNECQRCVQQDGQIQTLQIENGNLKRICAEQSQMIEKLKSELAKFQCRPEEFEDFIAMPLSPMAVSMPATPQTEKCFVCLAEYMTNDGQKHTCNGEHEIGCEYCDQMFASTMDLVEHSNGCHNEKPYYCCTKCPEMFSMALLLQFHEMSHPIAEPIYICNVCSEQFLTQEEMNEHHDKSHRRPRKPKVSKAQPVLNLPLSTAASSEIKTEKKVGRPRTRPVKTVNTSEAAKRKPFKCAHCNECFKTSNKITIHMKRVHFKEKEFECYICKEKCKSLYKTQIHLREHIRGVKCVVCQEWQTKFESETHTCCGLKSMDCGYCHQVFTTTKSLLQHLQECKSEKISYECGRCPKYFLMEFLAELHRKNHKDTEPTKMYYCNMCSSSFNCRRQLQLHKERHNESRDYLCDECGKGFLCAANLRHHKRTHNKKTIKCTQCDFTCLGMTAYKRHLLRHQNIKFICNICNLQLSTSAKLVIHKKIHTRTEADRTHGCPVCFKMFFTSKSSRSHFLKAHTTKRFECDLCDQSYKYKGDLNKHKRAVHSAGYLYGCPHCGKRFPQSYELDHHLFEHATISEEASQSLPV